MRAHDVTTTVSRLALVIASLGFLTVPSVATQMPKGQICAWVACGDWPGADLECGGTALWMTCNGDGCEDGNNVIGCE